MVDCYLTTFKNNKGLFGDKKKVAQDIIGKRESRRKNFWKMMQFWEGKPRNCIHWLDLGFGSSDDDILLNTTENPKSLTGLESWFLHRVKVDSGIRLSIYQWLSMIREFSKIDSIPIFTIFNHGHFVAENPGKYHIYEGLSSLTNISRYDLPDPDTYRYSTEN